MEPIKCIKCGLVKEQGDFSSKSVCKDCKAFYDKQRREKTRKPHLCKGCGKDVFGLKGYCDECEPPYLNRGIKNDLNMRRSDSLKREVIQAYGGRCVSCGVTNTEFLCIDHIYDDGVLERRKLKSNGGPSFYKWLKDNGFPKDRYQLLCYNCNHVKELTRIRNTKRPEAEPTNIKKVCNTCSEEKDLSDFYFRNDRNRYIHTCKDCYQQSSYDKKLRQEVIGHYSNGKFVCDCCGENDTDKLCVDHINGDGNKQREATGDKKGRHFYRWLKKNNYPDGYRILCHNCNSSLGHYGYCAHEKFRGFFHNWLDRGNKCFDIFRQDEASLKQIESLIHLILDTPKKGGKILLCGAGGSLHDHFTSELVNRFSKERQFSFPAIDLSGSMCLFSAIANDYGYEYVFSKQIVALGKPEDLLIAISTSGKTEVVMKAVNAARMLGITSVLITGDTSIKFNIAEGTEVIPDIHIQIPESNTGIIQEIILKIIHAVCHVIDMELGNDLEKLL